MTENKDASENFKYTCNQCNKTFPKYHLMEDHDCSQVKESEFKLKDGQHSNEIVSSIVEGMIKELESYKLHPKENWLIWGRVCNYIYMQHYNPAVTITVQAELDRIIKENNESKSVND